MPLECFVAMAFGYDDTDKLYDKAVVPLLKRRGIRPFRVDRSMRNEDIDDQILAGLQRCDLVIADLTYARPSVYYEAGVAFGRKVPVLFTSRSDHFKHQPDDHHGNLRVHFDLQMKPIVAWPAPDNPAFLRRLAFRLDHITRPLLKEKETSALDQRKAAAFAPLPIREKLERLTKVYRATALHLGYDFFTSREQTGLLTVRPKHLKWCSAHFQNTFTRNNLRDYGSLYVWGPERHLKDLFEHCRLPQLVTARRFLVSLQHVSPRAIATAFPNSRIHTAKYFVVAEHKAEIEVWKHPKFRYRNSARNGPKTAKVPINVIITVISGLRHEGELGPALKESLAAPIQSVKP